VTKILESPVNLGRVSASNSSRRLKTTNPQGE
jgi:hypothetical protein